MLTMRRLAAFALLGHLVGCSGGIDYAHFDDALIDARCSYYIRCGLAANAAECTAYYANEGIGTASVQAALDTGKVVYHEDVAQDCLDGFAALSCDQTQQTEFDLDACFEVLTGTLAIGESCGFSLECESKNCAKPTCPDACCKGTCAAFEPLPSAGQPCTAFCDQDAYCGIDDICHLYVAAGGACTGTEPCGPNLYCAGMTATTAGTCTALPHLGQPCEASCAELGATCYGGTCVAVGLLDDPCTASAQCSMFYECRGMTCSLLPTLGMACTTSCFENAYCADNLCVAQKSTGAACARNDECKSHYCLTGTCTVPPACI
jgi:hypothetical protein